MSFYFTNNTGNTGNFKVVMSSSGGKIYPFVSLNGVFAYPGRRIETAKVLMEMIDLGTIENGKSVSVNFFTALTAVSTAPL